MKDKREKGLEGEDDCRKRTEKKEKFRLGSRGDKKKQETWRQDGQGGEKEENWRTRRKLENRR
jgi:hypothetical protein